MKRGTLLLAAAAAAVAALAMLPAGADLTPRGVTDTSPHNDCTPVTGGTIGGPGPAGTHAYYYCGYRWASTPVRFRVDTSGMPPIQNTNASNRASMFLGASQAAAGSWNQGWPGRPTASVACSMQGVLFCHDPGTNDVVVKFGSLPEGIVGRATVNSPAGKTITSAVVTLNSALTWRIAAGNDLITGEIPGLTGSACGSICGTWYDVENVVAHELGHVVGLEDVGNEDACGADLVEVIDYGQTMYGCLKTGDTSKRTLGWGDLLGLARLWVDYRT